MDVRGLLQPIAQYGTAPQHGCSLFGVGYEEALDRLREQYLRDFFEHNRSAEKFVIGPYGSGKTHFLRHLLELASAENCVTAEVQLNKNIDFTNQLLVYKEVASSLVPPDGAGRGVEALFQACLQKVRSLASDELGSPDDIAERWIRGLRRESFRLSRFGVILQRAFAALQDDKLDDLDAVAAWIEGDVSNRNLAKDLGVSPVTKPEQPRYAENALFSLFQLMKLAGFNGTVVAYDEAEQGLSQAHRRKRDAIHSILMSGINAIAGFEGAALVVYALTPDVMEQMANFPAIQQRPADPIRGRGFWEGETLAPRILLEAVNVELSGMGRKLAELVYTHADKPIAVDKEKTFELMGRIADAIAEKDPSISNRRTYCKHVATVLLRLHDSGELLDLPIDTQSDQEDEV